jgi:hypothetical protein
MSMTAQQSIVDPLHALLAGGFVTGTKHPIPLVATRFSVDLSYGLATVSTTRTFRNAETTSIEATITFPVPVHAVLFALEARIAGRVLEARAQLKSQARDVYESAIERGKSAVLHEEVLRGVHMVSVAHVAPGAEVEVSATWAMTLTNLNGRGRIRIPLTVGDIYGRSGLPDSDDLAYGGPVQSAELTVQCRDGQVTLLGERLDGGRAKILLNAPIDLEVDGWTPHDLRGRAADGREVVVRVEPAVVGDADLDVAIVIDHSGSMGEICSADRNLSKHQSVVAGLQTIADGSSRSDVVDLWEFENTHRRVGSTRDGNGLRSLIGRLSEPTGGTEIGAALAGVTARSEARDVLLVTDGKSHALDVQALARTGRRFCVVLVGEDSLEANVGHLAALTGGEIFVSAGADLTEVLDAALRSLRNEHHAVSPSPGRPQRISARRAGMTITASWQKTNGSITQARAVAALAASLALPALDTETAAALAEAEGLATHLTSLVLVDEAGAVQEGIPATRKVPLASPRVVSHQDAVMSALRSDFTRSPRLLLADLLPYRALSSPIGFEPSHPDLSGLGAKIDWDAAPQRLQAGDLSTLEPDVAHAIRSAAATTEVITLAGQLALDPVVLVLALIARFKGSRSRSAARLAKAIFGDVAGKELNDLAKMLCLT